MYSHRILYIVTHPMTAFHLLEGQLTYMKSVGFDVGVASSPGTKLDLVAARDNVAVFPIRIAREISPFMDAWALLSMLLLIHKWKPAVVYAATPKGGVIGMLAAYMMRVPVRIYGQWGLRLETTEGWKRSLLWTAEYLAAVAAHQIHSAGKSLSERCIELRIAKSDKLFLTHQGSTNGVAAERFASPNPEDVSTLRNRLGLPKNNHIIGFVGRLTRDKGIPELVMAFNLVRAVISDSHLLLVGSFESGDPVPEKIFQCIESHPAIIKVDFLEDTAPAYALMDVLAFPSYREGFPNVPLEAAASGLPVVGFCATGTKDAVVEGITGTLVEIGDVEALSVSLISYLSDDNLRMRHGQAGKRRVNDNFQQERIWNTLLAEYKGILKAAGHPLPIPSTLSTSDYHEQ